LRHQEIKVILNAISNPWKTAIYIRDVVDVPPLETLKVRLNQALGNLMEL